MPSPDVSVIIPAYNARDTIGDQLAALTRREFAFPWEIIVADNGSTDGTAELVEGFRATIPNLRVVDASARRGPSAARNIGAQAARAQRLAFCDADDIVGDDWVGAVRRLLELHEFVAGFCLMMHLLDHPQIKPYYSGPIMSEVFPYLPGGASGNMAIHKPVFEKVDGFDEALRAGEDLDFSWRTQLGGHRLVHSPSMIAYIRRREGIVPSFKQGFAYGLGDRTLEYRYAQVVAAYQARITANAPSTSASAPQPPEPGRRAGRLDLARGQARVIRKVFTHGLFRLASDRGRADLAALVVRPGRTLGRHFGKVNPTVSQVPAPTDYFPVSSPVSYEDARANETHENQTVPLAGEQASGVGGLAT